ncbi:MAG: branched-chain amino acid transport system ATP-binding protein [Pseudonocardiales bacterium]|jgi:branched-chain amino acid transport system ATP-binding protein|nr:branched-chain amino acid transport system ATP-binding protein [Pseudonocardiales bacterium]
MVDDRADRAKGAEGNVLSIEDVSLRFGGVQALNKVAFTIDRPQIVGLIGANGAGKSTLLNCVAGRFRPNSGRIVFYGQDVTSVAKHRIHAVGITRTFQNLGLFTSMSVRDNIAMGLYKPREGGLLAGSLWSRTAARHDRERRAEAERIAERLQLTTVLNRTVGELPYGLQKRVELGRAIASSPRLLLIDEPATGLSRAEVDELCAVIIEVAQNRDVSVLVVDHNFSFITAIAQQVVFMDSGRIAAIDTPEGIRKNELLRKQYLGQLAGNV